MNAELEAPNGTIPDPCLAMDHHGQGPSESSASHQPAAAASRNELRPGDHENNNSRAAPTLMEETLDLKEPSGHGVTEVKQSTRHPHCFLFVIVLPIHPCFLFDINPSIQS